MATEDQSKTLKFVDGYTDEITDELSEDGGTAEAQAPKEEISYDVDLGNDIFGFSRTFSASDIRYYAVGTEVVASEHDIYSGLERELETARKLLDDLVCILPYIYYHSMLGFGI